MAVDVGRVTEREHHLRDVVVDRLFDVAFVITPDGTVTWRRESSTRPLGIDDELVEGQLILGRVHPEDLPPDPAAPRTPEPGSTGQLRVVLGPST